MWSRLGGLTDRIQSLTSGRNQDGRLEVFGIAPDGTLWHIWQTAPNNGWSAWTRFHSATDKLRTIAVGRNQDGRLEVFGCAADDTLWHTWQTAPNNGWSAWTRFHSANDKLRTIAVGQNQDGRLEVFGCAADDTLWHTWQTAPNNGWSTWNRFHSANDKLRTLVVGQNQDGRLEVFGCAADDTLWHTWQTAPNNGWSTWNRFHSATDKLHTLAVDRNQDGRLEVFGCAADKTVWHDWQTKPNNGWNGSPPHIDHVIDINLILVGDDHFTNADRQKVADAVEIARTIYEKVGIGIRNVSWWAISAAEAGALEVIDDQGEAETLTDDWTVQNNALDVFVVRAMNGADGWSAVNGDCNKDGKGMTGSVVSLNGSTANCGNTFAHEMGHYLGLNHIADTGNFIGGNGSSNSWTGIYGWQGDTMKKHCFAQPA